VSLLGLKASPHAGQGKMKISVHLLRSLCTTGSWHFSDTQSLVGIDADSGFQYIMVQVVLCQINTFCHQLTQNTTTDFFRFTQIVLQFNTLILQVLNFRTICVNLRNLNKISRLMLVQLLTNMMIWQRITCSILIGLPYLSSISKWIIIVRIKEIVFS
jgi:hypothetical protein